MKENTVETANVVASIAHDLRSPLNAVIGFSRLMLKGIDGPLSDLQAVDLEAVHTNGLMMLRLVDDLIDLAKAEAGWFMLQPVAVHLQPLLEKVISLVTQEATETQIILDHATSDIARPVHLDRAQIQKGLQRLIAATVRLTGPGKITLTVRTDRERAVVYMVASSPSGLSPDTPHVLDVFHTAGTSSEHRVDATALQLLVGRQLLALSGGYLQIEATSDTEIRLAVHLPLAPL